MARPRAELTALVAEGFFSRLSFGLVAFGLPLLALRMGVDVVGIGVLLSLNLLVAIALKPVTGWAVDRIGLKPSLVAAIALRSAVGLLLVFAEAPWQLYAIRVLHGLSIAVRDPAVNTLIAELGGKRAVASSFAWYQTGKSAAGSIGKAMAGIVLGLTASSFPVLFGIALALSAIPLAVVARFVPRGAASVPWNSAPVQGTSDVAPAVTHVTLRYVGLGFLITSTAYMVAALFPVLAVEWAGLTDGQAGAVYLVGAVLALTGPLWGWLSDHVNHRFVLSIRGAANVISSALYLFVPSFAGFLVGKGLDDIGKAAFRPAWGAVMAHLAALDRRRRARVMANLSAGEDAGEVVAPVVAGLIWSAWGVPAVLLARIGLAIVTELYARRIVRPLAPSRDRDEVRPGPGRVELDDVAAPELTRGFSTTVEPRRACVIADPDGALAGALGSILTGAAPYTGAVRIDGHDIRDLPAEALRRVVAVASTEPPPDQAQVGDVLRERWPEAPLEELARAWLATGSRTPFLDALGRHVGELPAEDRRRVRLASSLVGDPSVLIVRDPLGDGVPEGVVTAMRRITDNHLGAVLIFTTRPERWTSSHRDDKPAGTLGFSNRTPHGSER